MIDNMMPEATPSRDELSRYHCLENADRAPRDPVTTAFKRRARLHQAKWRIRNGYPIGTEPIRPKPPKPARPLGSRLDFDFATSSNANFLGVDVARAVASRVANPQPRQMLSTQRLYADLLSSMSLCFNFFGHLVDDLDAADTVLHRLWPDTPGTVIAVHFEWSPGRGLRGEFLENRTAFDVAFELIRDDGTKSVVGVETKYHEHCKTERPPTNRRRRYELVATRSDVFNTGAVDAMMDTDLQQIMQDHLLALSMLQHRSGAWSWARFVLVYPARNASYASAAERYGANVADRVSFDARTLESLLSAGILPTPVDQRFRERYLW